MSNVRKNRSVLPSYSISSSPSLSSPACWNRNHTLPMVTTQPPSTSISAVSSSSSVCKSKFMYMFITIIITLHFVRMVTTSTNIRMMMIQDDYILMQEIQQQQIEQEQEQQQPFITTNSKKCFDYTTQTSERSISANNNNNSNNSTWPPMDMIYHIWDHISTNCEDKVQRRLVVAATNGQYTDFAINFVLSLIQQNVYNFVLVPLDIIAYEQLHIKFPFHTLPLIPELSISNMHTGTTKDTDTTTSLSTTNDGATFGSNEFKQVTSTRPIFLELLLQHNITIFYNDIDMVWQNNAWNTIDRIKYIEQQQQSKTNKYKRNDHTTNTTKRTISTTADTATNTNEQYDVMLWMDGLWEICTCMIYMVPSITSFTIIHEWKKEIQTNQHAHDQVAFFVMAQKHHLLSKQPPPKHKRKQASSKKGSTATITLFDMKHKINIIPNNEQFPTGAMYDWDQQIQNVLLQQKQQQSYQSTTSHTNHTTTTMLNTLLQNNWIIPYHKQNKTNPNNAIIVHNNWIMGKTAKVQRFIATNLWFIVV